MAPWGIDATLDDALTFPRTALLLNYYRLSALMRPSLPVSARKTEGAPSGSNLMALP